MRLIRRAAAQITTRRKKLAVGILVALAGSGGLAARAWQDGPAQGTASGLPKAAGLSPSTPVGQAQWMQSQGALRPAQAQSAGPGWATATGQRFPSQATNVAGFVNPSWRDRSSVFFSGAQSKESAEMDAKIRELLNSLRRNPEGEPKVEQELKILLAKQFDLRHAAQSQQVDKMKASLAEAEETLAKREENRDQIIERRAQQLLGQSDPLGWEYRLQTGTPSRPDSSLVPRVTYGVRLPADVQYGVPIAPQSPSSSTFPQALPQAPTPAGPPAQSAPGAIQSRSQLPGIVSKNDRSDTLLLQTQLNAAKENLRQVERLHERKVVSTSELAAAKSRMFMLEAQLKGSRDRLKLECETARIDLEAEMEELGLLEKESRQVKEGSSEAYNLLRLLSRSTASLRKAELQLDQKMQQLESLSEIVNAFEKEKSAESEVSDFETSSEEAETSKPEATPEATY